MSETTPFSLGVTYWPRNAGYAGWQAFDAGAVRNDLAHIADLGCDTVRVCLRWEDVQPGLQRVNTGVLRAFERLLEAAGDNRLRVVAALFAGAMGGAAQVPEWATGVTPGLELALTARFGTPLAVASDPHIPLLFAGSYHDGTPIQDLYADPQQLAAQRYQIGEVVGYFAAHPALWLWQIGHNLERVRRCRSTDEAYDWLAHKNELFREHGARAVAGAISVYGLTRRDTWRPEQLAELCDLLLLHAHPYEPLEIAAPADAGYLRFLHALVRQLAGTSLLVADIGLATRPLAGPPQRVADMAFGNPVRSYLADEDEQAQFVEAALNRLYAEGAAGAWLAAYADAPPRRWSQPPLDRAIRERTLGLVHSDGSEKVAAASLRTFATRLRQGALGARGTPPTIDVDPEAYWASPAQELRRLYSEWTTPG